MIHLAASYDVMWVGGWVERERVVQTLFFDDERHIDTSAVTAVQDSTDSAQGVGL
jgi:hypothetical protein